jgi:ABC-type transport system involved in cytochrome bd biosynthesis fused ATPase/permease subunit
MNFNVNQPMAALPLVVFQYATGPYEEWHQLAWASALVLILVVFVLSVVRGSPRGGGSMPEQRVRLGTDKLTAMYGKFTAVKNVSLTFANNSVNALIGPSGCGKSTFLRTLNRMHELTEGGWITGKVLL